MSRPHKDFEADGTWLFVAISIITLSFWLWFFMSGLDGLISLLSQNISFLATPFAWLRGCIGDNGFFMFFLALITAAINVLLILLLIWHAIGEPNEP